jgi:tetratricopeptide (TPR) repeat protein
MKSKATYVWMVTLLFGMAAGVAWAQTSRVHGKISAGNKPVPDVQVVLTSPSTGKIYKMKTDRNGEFMSIAVNYGQYNMEVLGPSGEKLFEKTVAISGQGDEPDLSADIGSGAKVSKEEIERIKAENAKATNINVLIKQYTDAVNNKAWADAENAAQQMVTMDPTRYEYFQALGGMKNNLEKYQEAIDSFDKGIQLAEAAAAGNAPKQGGNAPDPAKAKAAIGQMLGGEGNAYLKLGKKKEAIEAFTKAAERDPNPGTAYFNLCATQYNTGNTEGALAACDKAIAADPTRAEAYFIKGSLMMGASTMDKSGKLQAPEGTAETLNKYLEIAPTGSHANDVKEMLAAIGAKIETTYSGKKKK